MSVDFIARQSYYLHHLLPVWEALDPASRGVFYALGDDAIRLLVAKYGSTRVIPYKDEQDCGHNPIVAAAYGDAVRAADYDPSRPVILLEHGVGLTFGKAAYADGLGQRVKMHCFPVPSVYVQRKAHPDLKDRPHPVIGVPKLDPWAGEFNKPHPMPANPVIGIGFHHGDRMSRPGEVGSAWEHYIDVLPILAKRYRLLLHAHPSAQPALADKLNEVIRNCPSVLYTPDFDDLMRRADVYLNDSSSTLYEFLVTGKPVILLNAPWFDKTSHYGIRFWDYSDVGIQVDEPGFLEAAIYETLQHPETHRDMRARAVGELFPFMGQASRRAADTIVSFVKDYHLAHRQTRTPAPVYMPPAQVYNPGAPGFFMVRNTDSDVMYHRTLLAAGYAEVDHPMKADFIVHDAVHPGLDSYLKEKPSFITPHTPQSAFMWDGILPIGPTSCNFVSGEAAKKVLGTIGYPHRVEVVGFSRCRVRPFMPTEGRDLLIVPAHPLRRGDYSQPGYVENACKTLRRIAADRDAFGKITLCWNETHLDDALVNAMRRGGWVIIPTDPYSDPEPLQTMIGRMELADIVLSCGTVGCVSVAIGRPTVFFSETDEKPRSLPKTAEHPERYLHYLRFPLAAEDMTLNSILAVRHKPHYAVEAWKEQVIGGNFDPRKVLSVIGEYVPISETRRIEHERV